MARDRERVAKWLREMLPKKCCNCGSTKDLQYHHIVPVIFGGNEVPSNVAVLCGVCHDKVHYGKSRMIDHGEAVKAGQLRAKQRGRKVGRKPADGEIIMQTIAENSTQFNADSLMTEHEIMGMLKIKEVCYAKYKRKLFEAMTADVWPYSWEKPVQVRNRPLYDGFIRKMRGDAV